MDQKLRKRFGNLLQHGRWIIAGTLLSMLIAFVISHVLPKIYAATTYILVSEARASNANATAWDFTLIPTYLPLVDNDAIVANALQDFHLDQAPFRLNLHRFRQKGYLDVRLPKSTRLIEIDVRFPDARLAAGVANYVAESAVEMNDRANELEAATTEKTLKGRLDHEAAHLSETEATRVALQQRARMESREAQLEALLDERSQVSKQIESLQLAAPGDGALKSPFSTNPQAVKLNDKVDSDRHWEASSKKLDLDEAAPPQTHRYSNATHDQSRRKSADFENVAEGGGALEAASPRLLQINRRINDLLTEITQLRGEIERSDQDFQLASEAYEKASREYDDAPMTVKERSVTLRQVSPALIPEQPVGPGALVNALLAGVFALALSCAVLLALEILREIRSESHGRVVEESEAAGAPSV